MLDEPEGCVIATALWVQFCQLKHIVITHWYRYRRTVHITWNTKQDFFNNSCMFCWFWWEWGIICNITGTKIFVTYRGCSIFTIYYGLLLINLSGRQMIEFWKLTGSQNITGEERGLQYFLCANCEDRRGYDIHRSPVKIWLVISLRACCGWA